MSRGDRAVRLACQAIVLVWIASFLGFRALAPEEVRVPVKAAAVRAEPAPEPEPEPQAEPERKSERKPERAEPAPEPEAPEPEPRAEREPAAPEPRERAEPQPPEPAPRAEAEPRPAPEPIEPPPALPEPPAALARTEAEPAPAELAEPDEPDEPGSALRPVPVAEADVAWGGSLLSGDAPFPALQSRYEAYGSFREYAAAMQRLGARFVVVNRREIVGTIDPWTLETGALTHPAALSPRARDYAGEPELARVDRTVRREHGARAEVMLLVPRRMDAALFGGIARALAAEGREPERYHEIRARYERGPDGGIRLRVESAVGRDGREEPLPLLFDLAVLAGNA